MRFDGGDALSKGIIIVSEVPTHCRECDYFSMFCKITGTRLYYDKDGRMDNCPIITIRADIDGKGKLFEGYDVRNTKRIL